MSLPLSTRSTGFSPLPTKSKLTAVAAGLLLLAAYAPVTAQTTDTSASVGSSTAQSASSDTSATVYRGGPARTGFVAQDATPPLSIAWQNTAAPLTGNQSAPVEDNGVIFFGTAGSVYAVNASDGSVKWTYPTADALTNPDVAHPGLFDCPATVSNGVVYIGNDDHNLYAIDENTGALAWQLTTAGYIRSAPVVSNGVIYFGSGDSRLYAIREDNHQPVWGGEFHTSGQVTTAPAVSSAAVFFADTYNTVYSAALSSGRLVWSTKFDNDITTSPPTLAGGVVIVGSERDLFGISLSVGSTRWHITTPAALTAQIAVSGDGNTIYAATSDDDIVALDLQGHVQWTAPLGSTVTIPPVVTNNSVIAITHSGIVRVLDASNGQVRWAYSLASVAGPQPRAGSTISATPLVTAGALYTLADNGTLTAFKTGASDDLPPSAFLLTPAQNRPVAGAQIAYSIFVNDIGSGVNPSTVSLKVDGSSIPVAYDVNTGYIQVQTAARAIGSPVPVALPTLTSGTHALTLTVSDWRGNQLNKTWNFTVNDALNPTGSALPSTTTPGTSPDTTTPAAQNATGGTTGSASGGATPTAAAGTGTGGATASGSAASGTGSGTPTSGAQPTGSGGPGPVPSPATGSGPQPSTPTGGGAQPVSPGGSGLPPSPPI